MLYLQSRQTEEYFSIGIDHIGVISFDDTLAHIKFMATVDLYSQNMISEYIQSDGNMTGRLDTQWFFLNNKIWSIISHINVTNEDFITAKVVSYEREQECITKDVHQNVDIGDLDGDGDPDILMDKGSAIIIQSNIVTYDLRLLSYNTDTYEPLCEKFFLGSMDIGIPHPEFSEYNDGDIPQLGEIFTMNIVDYSYDLESMSLYWYDDVTLHDYILIQTITVPVDTIQNYFAFDVNSDLLGIPEGSVNFKVEGYDGANPGEKIISTIIDRTLPATALSFTYESNGVVSISSDMILNITETNDLSSLDLSIHLDDQYETLLYSLSFDESQLVSKEITINLLADIIDKAGITESNLIIRFNATDKAGNIEEFKEFAINIDSEYSITFYDDDTYSSEITGDLNVVYGELVYGILKDSFEIPLPMGFEFDLQLNNLTYIRSQISDNQGKFTAQILSGDMYSEDLRYSADTILNVYDDQVTEFSSDKNLRNF